MPLTGDLAHDTVMCPDWELNWWPYQQPFSLQDDAQPLSHTSQGMDAVHFLMAASSSSVCIYNNLFP